MTTINKIISRLESKHSRFKELQGSADVLRLIEAYRKLDAMNDVLREQNIMMNKSLTQLKARGK